MQATKWFKASEHRWRDDPEMTRRFAVSSDLDGGWWLLDYATADDDEIRPKATPFGTAAAAMAAASGQ